MTADQGGHVPGPVAIPTEAQLAQTARTIVDLQRPDGLVLWTPGGHADPWNHVETAMALDVSGFEHEATRAYHWMQDHQLPDGSWHQYYGPDRVEDPKYDANTIAYIATGAWHRYLLRGDETELASRWPMIERAIDWVLELQQPTGEILWAREPDGTAFHYALLTGSSSIAHSLGSALHIAATLGKQRRDWTTGRARLTEAIQEHPLEFFAPKERWAMDWYYPVLAGILTGDAATAMLWSRWDEFVLGDWGVRCVNDHPWVTTGETAELAIALAACGRTEHAEEMLATTSRLRDDDGSYWTGLHVPSQGWFPEGERTAYSAAAVLLAADMLRPGSATSRTFCHGHASP